jgi:hypothetical protein
MDTTPPALTSHESRAALNKELALTSQQIGLLVGIFFFGYFLLKIRSNLMLHQIGAPVWT